MNRVIISERDKPLYSNIWTEFPSDGNIADAFEKKAYRKKQSPRWLRRFRSQVQSSCSRILGNHVFLHLEDNILFFFPKINYNRFGLIFFWLIIQ